MKTKQLMKREFGDTVIEQRTDNSYLNATDLLRVYNLTAASHKRFLEFWSNKNTQEFLEALSREVNHNGNNSHHLKTDLYITQRGKGGSTWMHPYLFVKFAMWLSADFEVKVIKWVYDNLIKTRNEAGDHYLEMTTAIKQPDPLIFVKEANFLKELAFGYREKSRNEATEEELKLLNALQKANIQLIKDGIGKDERQKRLRDFAKIYS